MPALANKSTIPPPGLAALLQQLHAWANPANVKGMARYGIRPHRALGIPMPRLQSLAKQTRRNHPLALELWDSGIHEARILAALVADPVQLTEAQMEHWVVQFDSWDICDQCCNKLFVKSPLAYAKAAAWCHRQEEFVKRAGFVLYATQAVHDKKAADKQFLDFLPIIEREASDDRNFVKKAVNWALRQIGKRNQVLHQAACVTSRQLAALPSASARWIGKDALRELLTKMPRHFGHFS